MKELAIKVNGKTVYKKIGEEIEKLELALKDIE